MGEGAKTGVGEGRLHEATFLGRFRLADERAGTAASGLQECQQVGIELILVRVGETVGAARVDLKVARLTSFDEA